MSERESAQFSDSTNQILRALDGEAPTRNPAFSATTNAILDAIEEGGGGSGLPDVTSADNGKVLGVVNGAWDKTTAEGGAPFIATYTITGRNQDGSYSLSCDKTDNEIIAAFSSQIVLAKMDISALADQEAGILIVYAQLSMTVASSMPMFSLAIYQPSLFGNTLMVGTIIHDNNPRVIMLPVTPGVAASYDSSTNTLNFSD